MRRQELSGSVQCSGRFVEHRREGLEDVRHPRGDVEDDLDVGGGGLSREADGVVEENLVTSGLEDQGRQPGQVGEYRTTWRRSISSTVISSVGTPPDSAAVTVTSVGSGCADSNSRSSSRCSSTVLSAGK